MSANGKDNPGTSGHLAGLKEAGAMRWGNPNSVPAVPLIRKEVCPVGLCWEKDVEGLLNQICAHKAQGGERSTVQRSREMSRAVPTARQWGWGGQGRRSRGSSPNENAFHGVGAPNHNKTLS